MQSSLLAAWRLRAQQLVPKASCGVAELVAQVGGIQAQEIAAAQWSIGTRLNGATVEDVERARNEERSIVLLWAMRGTRHLVAAEDVGWLLPLLAPHLLRGNRRRYAELELTVDSLEDSTGHLQQFLRAHGAQPRAAIAKSLQAAGFSTEGQRLIHRIGYATLSGALCFGPTMDNEDSWVALDNWLPIEWQPDGEGRLARRYFEAFAPATLNDFAAWSGLPMAEARQGMAQIADELVPVEIEGVDGELWRMRGSKPPPQAQPAAPVVRFLPRYDTLLLGYDSRGWILDNRYARRIYPGGGMIHAAYLVDGRIAGTWKLQKSGAGDTVIIAPFEPHSTMVQEAICAEAATLGQFRQQPIRCEFSD